MYVFGKRATLSDFKNLPTVLALGQILQGPPWDPLFQKYNRMHLFHTTGNLTQLQNMASSDFLSSKTRSPHQSHPHILQEAFTALGSRTIIHMSPSSICLSLHSTCPTDSSSISTCLQSTKKIYFFLFPRRYICSSQILPFYLTILGLCIVD